MALSPTIKLYLQDERCFETVARCLEVADESAAFDQTCFYPGGGGQPPDQGHALLEDGRVIQIITAFADPAGVIWHSSGTPPTGLNPGMTVRLAIEPARRLAIMRYHTVLHVLNTIALRDHQAWITGVQIGPDQSRIDFKVDNFSITLAGELEAKVNAVLAEDHPVRSYYLSEPEFQRRPDLIRTLTVKPPVVDGRVRVVEITGFDAQACGGTHVRSTGEVGHLSIVRIENKGRLNKRLYVRLD